MKAFANFKAFCPNGNYFRFLFMRKALCLSDTNFDLPFKQSKCYNYCAKIHPVPTAICFNSQIQRAKTSKAKSSSDQNDSDVSDDDEIESKDDESFSDEEVDFDTPLDYTHSLVHSLRADIIVAKGFSKSSRETEKMFYESKFLYRGKTLSKKAKKLDVGDYLDIIHEESKDKAKVQRVKVVKILNRQTKKGKPVVAIRVWKKPFETKKLDVGDYIDIIHEESKDKAKVQRVKVVKILNRQTKKGKPVVAIRVWKKPFETKKVGS